MYRTTHNLAGTLQLLPTIRTPFTSSECAHPSSSMCVRSTPTFSLILLSHRQVCNCFFIYVYIFTKYSFIIFIYHHKPYTSPNQRFVILYLLVFNHFLLSVEYTVFYYSYSLFIFTSRMSSRKGSFLVMSVCTIGCLSSSPASAKAAPHVCWVSPTSAEHPSSAAHTANSLILRTPILTRWIITILILSSIRIIITTLSIPHTDPYHHMHTHHCCCPSAHSTNAAHHFLISQLLLSTLLPHISHQRCLYRSYRYAQEKPVTEETRQHPPMLHLKLQNETWNMRAERNTPSNSDTRGSKFAYFL